MKLSYRVTIIGLAAAAVAGFVYTQVYIHEKNRREIREVAAELALTWRQQLNLTLEQTQLLEDAIIEFTIKKNEIINSSLGIAQQVSKLKTIQKSEHQCLQQFMDTDQFDRYIDINKQLTRKS